MFTHKCQSWYKRKKEKLSSRPKKMGKKKIVSDILAEAETSYLSDVTHSTSNTTKEK